ncbi:hypothetical protein Tco_0589888 [Tanacetum coccineum]
MKIWRLNLEEYRRESLIYNTSFLGEYECSSLALKGRRKEGTIGSLKTRLSKLARKKATSPMDSPTVPDISGGRSTYQGTVPRLCDGEDGGKGLATLGECGGEALCDRGGEGGRRMFLLQTSLVEI